MVRVLESIGALGMIAVCAPLFVITSAGLRFSGVRPLLVVREVSWKGGLVPRLEFNTPSSRFGHALRELSVHQLPALFWVVTGKCRFADLPVEWRRR